MIKHSVSIAVRDPARPGCVLIVQRPHDDQDLANVWGLPAASLTGTETWTDAARRAGREKLGVSLEIGHVLGEGVLERTAHTLQMRLLEARIVAGEPRVPQPVPGVTQYQAWRWGRAEDLQPAAATGSLCSRLYLEQHGT